MNRKNTLERLIALVLLLTFSVFFLNACGNQKEAQEKTEKQINIGLITPLSGEVADLGKEMLSSANIAVQNAQEDSSQYKLNIIPRDDQMSAAAASTAVKSLIGQDKAIAIVGAGMSSVVRGSVEALQGKNIPLVTSTATASDLAEGLDYVFRVIPPNAAQGKSLAEFAIKLNAKKAAILFQQDDYSKDLKKAFAATFGNNGREVVIEVGFESEESDFRTQLDRINSANPDIIVCAAQHVPVARILVRAKEMKIQTPILSGETAFTDKLLAAAGEAAEGFYVTGPPVDIENPTTNLKNFIDAYEKENGKKPGIYGCYTYDAVSLLCSLIKEKSIETGETLIQELKKVHGYAGITGDIDFDEKGDVQPSYKIYNVKEGVFKLVN